MSPKWDSSSSGSAVPLSTGQSQLGRVQQITDSHCGPAVLEILLKHLNIHASQAQLAAAVGADDFIEERGMRVDELATSIKKVFPEVQFWYKDQTTNEELETILQTFQSPVGVEWQGLFYSTPEEEEEDIEDDDEMPDFGHYSVVKSIDIENDTITLIDPFRDFADQDRIFSLEWFESRWWDANLRKVDGYMQKVRDERMIFVLTRKGTYFPKMMEMTPA
jgi:hypothetical protein